MNSKSVSLDYVPGNGLMENSIEKPVEIFNRLLTYP